MSLGTLIGEARYTECLHIPNIGKTTSLTKWWMLKFGRGDTKCVPNIIQFIFSAGILLRVGKNINFRRITTSAMLVGTRNILLLQSSVSYSFTDP